MNPHFSCDNVLPKEDLFLDDEIRPSSIQSWFPALPEDFYFVSRWSSPSGTWEDIENERSGGAENGERSLANRSSGCFSTSTESQANEALPSIGSIQEKKAQEEVKTPQKRLSCNCNRSKCIKGYCQCLQGGQVCSPETCGCTECQNVIETEVHQEKVRRGQASERKGCTCKRTQCSKRYCDCRKEGNACGAGCECVGCQNKNEKVAKKEDKLIIKLRSRKSPKKRQ